MYLPLSHPIQIKSIAGSWEIHIHNRSMARCSPVCRNSAGAWQEYREERQQAGKGSCKAERRTGISERQLLTRLFQQTASRAKLYLQWLQPSQKDDSISPLYFKASGSWGCLFSFFPGRQEAKNSVLMLLQMQSNNCSPLIFQTNRLHCRIARPIVSLLYGQRNCSACVVVGCSKTHYINAMKTSLNHHRNLAPKRTKLTRFQTSAVSSCPGFPVSGKVRPWALPVTYRVPVSSEHLHVLRANAKLLCAGKPGQLSPAGIRSSPRIESLLKPV